MFTSSAAADSLLTDDNVLGVSNAPVLELIGDKSVSENSTLTFELSVTDSHNSNIRYFSSNLPEGASLDNISGVFEWIPRYDQSGVHYVEFIANDGEYNDSEYIAITVLDVNRPPVFSTIADSETEENAFLEITLMASDPDDDILEFTKNVPFGTISNNKFSWLPSYNDSGNYTINFAVNDGSEEVVRTAKINVKNVNRQPILYYISDVAVNVSESVNISLAGFDPDGYNLIYSNVSALPDGASFNSSTGIFQWIPTKHAKERNNIVFTANDGISSSNVKAVEIMVDVHNSPPVFNPISPQSVNENSTLSFEISAIDYDGDGLSYSMRTYPDDATFESTTGSFEWTPSYEQAGTYVVEFMAMDNGIFDFKSFASVLIDVHDVNRAPVIYLDETETYTVNETETLFVNLSVSDIDGDSLSLSTNASFGTLRGNTFIWTPDYSDSGIYDVQFLVSDGDLNSSASATIFVDETNMPPELERIGSRTVIVNDTLLFTVNASDGYNDELFLSANGLPAGATFNNSSGFFSWSPTIDQKGLHTVSFQVTDQELNDYETISINVKEQSENSNETTPTTSSSISGGGGGGGGSQNTGEAYENIDFKDYTIKPVLKDVETVFSFVKKNNSITSVSFTTGINGGQTRTVIEMLKKTSTLVSKAPSGNVYKNLNIWVGDGKILPEIISDAKIAFKVEKSWISSNDIDPDSIKLLRYSGDQWTQLPTSRISESDEYSYYVAETPGFSPFSISSVEEEAINSGTSGETIALSPDDNNAKKSVDDKAIKESNIANQDEKSTGSAIFILVLLGVVFIGLFGYTKREYCEQYYEKARMQFGNPDGKRYRRLKR
ncbi:PGF-pre-PGF domain-containing protein [Methanolobus sp. ZRKC2]|uniref:PGF-pre-PGF domain-containing protein n=1 Tax=Methanolobus sp. ZRKC2 TaxID=3125783 RepID=UPI00324D9876